MENLPRLGLALVLLYGGLLAIDGEVTVGTLFAFNAYVLLLQAPFRMLGFFLMLGQRAAASAERIYEILDEPRRHRRPARRRRPGRPRAATSSSTTSCFRYTPDGPAVLDGFTLHVRPGETVALVGRTGIGQVDRRPAARPLLRRPRPARVRVDGHDVARPHARLACGPRVGIVLDEPFLFSTSVRDNIAYGRPDADRRRGRGRGPGGAGRTSSSTSCADGYDTVVGERGYTLSGGQRQRIAIARTLLADPADPRARRRHPRHRRAGRGGDPRAPSRELLADRTTIVIAHRLSTIALADRVAAARGRPGRRRRAPTPSCWRTEPRYAAVLATRRRRRRATPTEVAADGLGTAGGLAVHGAGRRRRRRPPAGLPFAGVPAELQDGVAARPRPRAGAPRARRRVQPRCTPTAGRSRCGRFLRAAPRGDAGRLRPGRRRDAGAAGRAAAHPGRHRPRRRSTSDRGVAGRRRRSPTSRRSCVSVVAGGARVGVHRPAGRAPHGRAARPGVLATSSGCRSTSSPARRPAG